MSRSANKKGIEFSFGWIFALIVGAVVIFLAIYAVSTLIRQQGQVESAELAKQLSIVLNPIGAGIESGKITPIAFPEETRVFNTCLTSGDTLTERTFGIQEIATAVRKKPGNTWGEKGAGTNIYNKYIFSASTIEDSRIIAFSKHFNMPFSVGDIVYFIPDKERHCFVNPPNKIEDEITAFASKNFNITDDIKKCSRISKKICFSGISADCDIVVDLQAKSVKKDRQTLYYADDSEDESVLLFGAIFGDPGIYNCQTLRLFKRSAELADLYRQKSLSLSARGCNSNLESELEIYANRARNITNLNSLGEIEFMSEEIDRRNVALSCKLY